MKVIDLRIAADKPPEVPEGLSLDPGQAKRLNSNKGFTLVELIVVSAIIGVLVLMAIPAMNRFINQVKVTSAIAEIRGIEKDVWAMIVDQNRFPDSLAEIGLDGMLDPWNRPYQYFKIINAGVGTRLDSFGINDLNTDFDLYSFGPDGVSQQLISDPNSLDDIVRAIDGNWIGEGDDF